MSPTFRSLAVRNYRLFAAGQAVSLTGTWMQRIAQDWLVLRLTHDSGTALGITTGLQFAPILLLSMYGGVLADRYSKRRILVLTQGGMALVALTLGLLDVTGLVQVWQVYLLAFLHGIGNALDNPVRQSFVHEMVGKDDLPNAVSLNSATFNLARITGPAVAGLVIAAFGTGVVFLGNAVSFAAVICGLLAMRVSELHVSDRVSRGRGQLREGLRYVRRRPDLMLVLTTVLFVATFGLNFQMTMALMAKAEFDRGAASFGLLSTAVATGSLVGALLAARRGRPRHRLLVGAAITFSLLEMATGLMPSYLTFMAMLVPTGVAILTFTTSANATIQLGSSSAMRGRVMGLYLLAFLGTAPVGAPLIGWFAEIMGPRASIVGGGALSLAGTLLAVALFARRQGVVFRARLRPRPQLIVLDQQMVQDVKAS
ncbi:MAG: MFS transporter [Actinomycetes bacterium]